MLKIRDAENCDIEELTEIYNWAVVHTTATFDIVPQTVEARLAWFHHYGGKYPLLVAELDGRVAGYSSLSRFREKEAYARTVEVSVYVHPDFQGKGLGNRLLTEVLQQARELGHHVVMAGITAGNDISIKMHEKNGFELCGTFRELGWKFDRWLDVLFYQLVL